MDRLWRRHNRQPNEFRIAQSEKGFVLAMVTICLPLLTVALIGFLLMALVLRNHSFLNSSCRRAVYETQSALSLSLKKLLKLNPRATRLRTQRRIAEQEVKAARASKLPPLIAAAEAHRLSVIAQQWELRFEQNLILNKAREERRWVSTWLHQSLARFPASSVRLSQKVSGLAVHPEPFLDASPDYKVDEPFSEKQIQILEFKSDLLTNKLPKMILSGLEEKLVTGVKCAATLKKEGAQWQPALAAARL